MEQPPQPSSAYYNSTSRHVLPRCCYGMETDAQAANNTLLHSRPPWWTLGAGCMQLIDLGNTALSPDTQFTSTPMQHAAGNMHACARYAPALACSPLCTAPCPSSRHLGGSLDARWPPRAAWCPQSLHHQRQTVRGRKAAPELQQLLLFRC